MRAAQFLFRVRNLVITRCRRRRPTCAAPDSALNLRLARRATGTSTTLQHRSQISSTTLILGADVGRSKSYVGEEERGVSVARVHEIVHVLCSSRVRATQVVVKFDAATCHNRHMDSRSYARAPHSYAHERLALCGHVASESHC